ncbi:MAG: DoxX family protein [Phycisphaerales bacterium]
MTECAATREVVSVVPSAGLLALRMALGGLFIVAAYLKLFASDNSALSFAEAIQAFKVLESDSLVRLATFCIPWVELVAGVSLILGFWTRAAGLIFAVLLAMFIALIVSTIFRLSATVAELQVQLDALGASDPGRGVLEARIRDYRELKCSCFGEYRLLCKGAVGWCKVGENALLLLGAMALQTWGSGRFGLDGLLRGAGAGGLRAARDL